LRIALAQMAPVWLNYAATLEKIEGQVENAAAAGAQLVVFGEALRGGFSLCATLVYIAPGCDPAEGQPEAAANREIQRLARVAVVGASHARDFAAMGRSNSNS